MVASALRVQPFATATRTVAPRAVTARPATCGIKPAPKVHVFVASRGSGTACKAGVTEVAQIAADAGFIGGTAATVFAMTLLGLALGFVLLRVESLVEEGKI